MFSNNKFPYVVCMNLIIYFSGISNIFHMIKFLQIYNVIICPYIYIRGWIGRQSKCPNQCIREVEVSKNASDIFKQFKESRRILFDLWKQWWCWQYRILTATIIIHKRIVKHIILTVMWTVLSFFAQRYSAEFIT